MEPKRLGALPRTPRWREVVALLRDVKSSTAQIVSATAVAARVGLERAKGDEGLSYSFWLLCQIPLAARQDSFAGALRSVGLDVPDAPSAFDIAACFTQAVDSHLRLTGGRTDIGEMAQMAAAESLTSLPAGGEKGLFSTPAEDVQNAFRAHSTKTRFGYFAQDFFARFVNRLLAYHLSRELSNHVGPNQRFASISEHEQFKKGLERYCRQAARIVREYAGAWYSKTNYVSGITLLKAKRFVAHAMGKLSDELARRKGRVLASDARDEVRDEVARRDRR